MLQVTNNAVFVFQSLSDPNNYHEFCRLLARLKSNYQLGELVKVENYPEVIRLIANFTVTSLQVLCVSVCVRPWRQIGACLGKHRHFINSPS